MRIVACCLLSLVLAMPSPIFGQTDGSRHERTLQIPDVASSEAEHTRLHQRAFRVFIPPDVIALYNILAPMSGPEQKIALRTISPETKTLLWKHNLSEFVRQHPELSDVQREVIDDAIQSMIALTFDQTCTGECDNDRKILSQGHREWAEAVFPVELLRAAFLRLGNDPDPVAVRRSNPRPPLPETLLGCDCASWYECWFWGTCIQYHCVKQPDGCGFYNNEPCGKYCA
jgi:hypothetical protein